MATATVIYEPEMRDFLESQGFEELSLPGVKELTFGKIVQSKICLRVFTSLRWGKSRKKGQDAIRCVLFYKNPKNEIKMIGAEKRVHRVEGWRHNLQNRLDHWEDMIGPKCECGAPTVLKEGPYGEFWSCSEWPNCPVKGRK